MLMTMVMLFLLERMESNKHSSTFKISKKCIFFYTGKDPVVYPDVELLENTKGFMLENRTITEILYHMEENKFQHMLANV